MRRFVTLMLSAAVAAVVPAGAIANEEAVKALAEVGQKYQMDMKKLFATNCSWCHDGYGMDGGKAPKLAGTKKSQQQVMAQIANGKPGYMPAYKNNLKAEQIEALAAYIKALPVD